MVNSGLVNCWSATLATSGAKREWVPLWAAVVTLAQPQPPGTQVATAEAYPSSVPVSKVLSRMMVRQGVAVGVGVGTVGVGVGVQ